MQLDGNGKRAVTGEYKNTGLGILPTAIEGCRGEEIAPDVWLITDPTFKPNLGKWSALANVRGALAVVELKVWIQNFEAVA